MGRPEALAFHVVRPVVGSAPGKLILAGEHSVVFGRPALVAATDLRLEVRVEASKRPGVLLDLSEMSYRGVESLDEIRRYAESKRRLWRAYSEDPTAESFVRLESDHPAHLVRLAVAQAVARLETDSEASFDVRVSSSLPIGSGLGSSAALGATVIGAVLLALGEEPRPSLIEKLALRVEEIQHGRPSGLDTAAVVRGGLLWRGNTADNGSFVGLSSELPALRGFVAFDTGQPPETTGTVVSWVTERRRREPAVVDRLLSDLEAGTCDLRVALERRAQAEVLRSVRALHSALVALGVVPPRIAEIVDSIEKLGGAAKISGAGSLQGPSAGSLLVYHPQPEVVRSWEALRGLEILTAELGCEGLRLEALG